MPRTQFLILPRLQRLLTGLGDNIRSARLRRRFSAGTVAERAGMSRTTLRAIERGDASVMLGAYARVLLALGLENDISMLAQDDELGRKLQDLGLPVRARAPRRKKAKSDE